MIKSSKTAIFVAGPNGAGKSTLIDALQGTNLFDCFLHINPDIIVREHGFEETIEGYQKAFDVAESKFEEAISSGQNILRETVLSSERKLDDIRRLREQGYEVYMLYISTDNYDVNVLNVVSRVEKGGHDVPISKLIPRYKKSMKNIRIIAPELDCVVFIDNSEISVDPSVCTALSHGSICYVATNVEWVDDIVKAFPKITPDPEKVKLCQLIQGEIENRFLELTEAPVSYIDISSEVK